MQVVCRRLGGGRVGPPAEEGQDGPLYGFTSSPWGRFAGSWGDFPTAKNCKAVQSGRSLVSF